MKEKKYYLIIIIASLITVIGLITNKFIFLFLLFPFGFKYFYNNQSGD